MKTYSIGCDPGWRNASISISENTSSGINLLHSKTLDPSVFPDKDRCSVILKEVSELIDPGCVSHFVIERYVSYQGVNTAESENILMLIGGLRERGFFLFPNSDILLLRAIDWKISLAKHLFKTKGFQNPSLKLDKVFSIAAAKACYDNNPIFKTDHDADSAALAALPFLKQGIGKNPKPRT